MISKQVGLSHSGLPETHGKPRFFATAFTHNGAANGLLVESHEGWPTKIEGNPTHPASRGAIDAFAQASILTLYDPDRSQMVTNGGTPSGGAPMFDAKAFAAHQFDDVEQQHEASWLGMWIFLATEVMMFGGMFAGYAIYRFAYSDAFT